MMDEKFSQKLSNFYSAFVWPDDPENERGKEYFETAVKFMCTLTKHRWIKKMLSEKEKISILEVCGGVGFGGVALSKALARTGADVSLSITDLRKDALERARKWGSGILGKGIEVSVLDAREVHKLEQKFDIVLLYGLSTPHFSPWNMVRLFASVSESLVDDGVFVADEVDRRYNIFLRTGYKWTLAEGEGDNMVISFHSGYNMLEGMVKRSYINPSKLTEPVTAELFIWAPAEVGAILWTFFDDVDFLNLGRMRCFVLGFRPRRTITPDALNEPTIVSRRRNG